MPEERALTLYRNGSVYSAADPFASAMLVEGGTVAWVGSEQAAASLVDDRMAVVDLDGALVAPGFVDSHVHVADTGLALSSLDLSAAASAADLLDAVARAAEGLPADAVLRGHGWDESRWAEPALPGAEQLARAAGGRRTVLTRVDVHSALVSPELAGGGSAGETALVAGDALHAARAGTRPAAPEELGRLHGLALRHAASRGYVALVEQAAPQLGGVEDLRLLLGRGTASEPEVIAYWGQAVSSADEARAVLGGLGVPVHGLAGDLNIDGSIGSRTALLGADYDDAPGHRGTAFLTAEQIGAHLAAVSEIGVQGGFHVIGDAGLQLALDGFRLAAERVGQHAVRAAGHRLEHVEMAGDAEAAALAEYAVTVSAQPLFDAAWGHPGGLYEQRLGRRREGMNPFIRFYSAGVPLAFGSDSPVCALSPWESVRACLTHSDPSQRISARAAFLGHTRSGWRAVRHPNPLMGQLVPGAPASFAVWRADELMVQVADERVQAWSTDPRARTPLLPALDTEQLPECLLTVHEGRQLFSSGAVSPGHPAA
ncbi:amidohydrolase [Sinomonas atrocyanea]|uniref:amidohydrolase n=1 Tax=Sinomonas atrocyanea TaxID=37927 RepID=UPI002789CFF3|nr:amidohydrolase family protein [Sinomonas atrocyanea]MDQ0261227.1 putative amidohydrolase YtcJ [Sinomonas atrocyanea]MDR6619839.1 putative amidohydrolase YtcJ [Sinomonas atrocyanea]